MGMALFFSWYYSVVIDSSLVSPTDYMDHLERSIEPPDRSQYFIANFV